MIDHGLGSHTRFDFLSLELVVIKVVGCGFIDIITSHGMYTCYLICFYLSYLRVILYLWTKSDLVRV